MSFIRSRDWSFPAKRIIIAQPLAKPRTVTTGATKKPIALNTRASIRPVYVESMNIVAPRTGYVQKPQLPSPTTIAVSKVIQPLTGYVHKPKVVVVTPIIKILPKVIQPRTGYVNKPKEVKIEEKVHTSPIIKTLPPHTVQKPTLHVVAENEVANKKKRRIIKKRRINLDIKEPRMEERSLTKSQPSQKMVGSNRPAFTVGPKKVERPIKKDKKVEIPQLGDTKTVKEVVTSKINATPKIIGNPHKKMLIVPGIIRPKRI